MVNRHDMNSAGGPTILALRRPDVSNADMESQIRRRALARVAELSRACERLAAAVLDRDGKIIELEANLKASSAACEKLRGQIEQLTTLLRRTAEYAPEHIAQMWSAAEVAGQVCGIDRASVSFWKNRGVPKLQPLPEPGDAYRKACDQHEYSDFTGGCVRCGLTKLEVIHQRDMTCRG